MAVSTRYLREQLDVPEARIASRVIPDTSPADGIYIVDTAEMFSALEGHSADRRGLERACRLLKMQELQFMHNAGNDAHVSRICICLSLTLHKYVLTYLESPPQ